MKKFNVVYLWNGERHVHLSQFTSLTLSRARALVFFMAVDGWQAWIEEVAQ